MLLFTTPELKLRSKGFNFAGCSFLALNLFIKWRHSSSPFVQCGRWHDRRAITLERGVRFSWSIGHFCAGFILCCKNTSGTGLHKAAPGGCRIGLGAGTPDEERLESPLSRLTFVVGCPVWRLSRSPGIAPQSSLRSIEILRGEQRVRVFRSGGGLIGGSEGEVSETAIV